MNLKKLAALSSIGLGILVGSTGCSLQCEENEEDNGTTCVAKPLKFVQASNPKVSRVNYRSGGSLDLAVVNGSITIVRGEGDQVVVESTPRTGKPQETPDEEFTAELEDLNERTLVEGNAQGDTIVTAPGGGFKSVSVVVRLPPAFNGTIKLSQGNGSTKINDSAGATAIDVLSENGSCDLRGSTSVVSTLVNCENGSVSVDGVADYVNIIAGNGDLFVHLASISGGGGEITADNGDIELALPLGDSYSVQARAGSSVDFQNPNGCTVSEAAVNSKTLSCGQGGPVYQVEALRTGATISASY
ncbi:MAG: DUF4097 family beta strand repeat protein [Polyangiaceae bacterium]|nr:DUF4097 family beta strand repeat protein [Polyangiaceae bacterium]MCW5791937.1 DUF4097 family beta strand repeat protein [Polyangiaceae bacterium]